MGSNLLLFSCGLDLPVLDGPTELIATSVAMSAAMPCCHAMPQTKFSVCSNGCHAVKFCILFGLH
jgi:hypothetical protein